MNSLLLDEAIKETLYESHSACSWQPAAPKDRQQFALGEIYPSSEGVRHSGAGCSAVEADCLVRANIERPLIKLSLRFLHPVARTIGSLSARMNELGGGLAQAFQALHELTVEGRQFRPGQESVQREINPPLTTLDSRASSQASFPFRFYASREFEPIRDGKQQIAGAIFRWQEGLEGLIELEAEPAGGKSFKLTTRLVNRTPLGAARSEDSDAILLRTFISTHVIVRAVGAEFVSSSELELR